MIVFVAMVVCCTIMYYCSILTWNVLNIRTPRDMWYVLRDIVPVSLFHQLRVTSFQDNLMFFWPCIMNWLYIDYQLDAPIIIYS